MPIVVIFGMLLLFFEPAAARRAPTCTEGRFLLPTEALIDGGAVPDVVELLADGTIAIGSGCPPVVAKLRGRRNGTTLVKAQWPKGTCTGLTGKVRLKVKIDATCTTMRGRIKAKRFRRKIAAERSRCADGVRDGAEDCPRLEGPPTDLAIDAVRDYDAVPPVTEAERDTDTDGRALVRTRIEIGFVETASIGEVNALLEASAGQIISMLAGVGSLVVLLPDPGTVDQLDAIVANLEGTPAVRWVLKAYELGPGLLPANYLPLGAAPLTRLDHHLAIRGGAAWNARNATRGSVPVVVYDWFGNGAPDPALFNVSGLPATDFGTTGLGPSREGEHGYHVLGTIAATFGGSSTPAGTATGMVPGTVGTRVVDRRALDSLSAKNRTIAILRNLPGNAVLNTSVEYKACSLSSFLVNFDARSWIEKVRAANLETRVLHVTCAGNLQPACPAETDSTTSSPFAAAALFPVTTFLGFAVPPLENTLAIENARNDAGPAFAPQCLSSIAKFPGHLAGIGTNVFSLTNRTGTAGNKEGCSMATPQVAGLAAYAWSIDPTMTRQQVMTMLSQTATALSGTAGGSGCAAADPMPVVDAYAAVLSLDQAAVPTPTTAPVRHAILNHDGDIAFDESDLVAFLAAYFTGFVDAENPGVPVAPTDPSFGREDLNGDGFVGGGRTAAFDLDRVDSVQYGVSGFATVQQPVEGTVATFDETAATDLDILCFYAHSELFKGDTAVRDTLVGAALCNPISLTVEFPATITSGVPEILRATVGINDPQAGGSLPFEGALIELDVLGGTALASDGTTDATGVFETEVALDPGSPSVSVVVRIRGTPDGPVLAEDVVEAIASAVTSTTTTTTPPSTRFQCLWEGVGTTCDPFPGCGCDVSCDDPSPMAIEIVGPDSDLTITVEEGVFRGTIFETTGVGNTLQAQNPGPRPGREITLAATLLGSSLIGRIEQEFGCGNEFGEFICLFGADFTLTCETASSSTTVTSTTTTSSTTSSSPTTTLSSTTTTLSSTTTTLAPPGGLPGDFRLYEATGPDAPPVTLEDEFRSESIDPGSANRYLVPVGIGGFLPTDPPTQRTCYAHTGAMFSDTVDVVNRFSLQPQTLQLGNPTALCVPDDIQGLLVDHFNCYAATGQPANDVVILNDRFQSQTVTVLEPILYCVPVDKNGEGVLGPPLATPTDPLTCYRTDPIGTAPGTVPISNQFHAADLDVGVPVGLCV